MKTEVSFVEELSLEELMAVKGGLNESEDNKPIHRGRTHLQFSQLVL